MLPHLLSLSLILTSAVDSLIISGVVPVSLSMTWKSSRPSNSKSSLMTMEIVVVVAPLAKTTGLAAPAATSSKSVPACFGTQKGE